MDHSNVQRYVISISNPDGRTWVVGTNTQRGFTEAGVLKAIDHVRRTVPPDWDVKLIEVSPISDVLVFKR